MNIYKNIKLIFEAYNEKLNSINVKYLIKASPMKLLDPSKISIDVYEKSNNIETVNIQDIYEIGKDITKIGIFAALVYLATFFLKIPSVNGYTHLGDAFIFLAVIIMGYKRGALAGAIGGALSDILGGYLIWVIPTFFIKSIIHFRNK